MVKTLVDLNLGGVGSGSGVPSSLRIGRYWTCLAHLVLGHNVDLLGRHLREDSTDRERLDACGARLHVLERHVDCWGRGSG